jgi:hypothetical protein
MKKLFGLILIGCVLCQSSHLAAADTAIVNITINVLAENDISFSGDPSTFNVTPGTSPVTDTSTTYGVITNLSNQRITAALTTGLPSGVSIAVNLAAPTGATSAGSVTLTTAPQNLVTGISQVSQSGLSVTYNVSATPTAAVANGITDTITYTIAS